MLAPGPGRLLDLDACRRIAVDDVLGVLAAVGVAAAGCSGGSTPAQGAGVSSGASAGAASGSGVSGANPIGAASASSGGAAGGGGSANGGGSGSSGNTGSGNTGSGTTGSGTTGSGTTGSGTTGSGNTSSGDASSPSGAHDGASPAAATDAAPPADAAAALGGCLAPTGAKWADAVAAYAKWKNDLLTTNGARGFMRVLRPNSPNAIDTSNSEGTAYGMLLAVAMNDPAVFDALWQYEQLFLDGNGLMNWEIDPTGTGPTSEGSGAATDADEDMAFALLWADARWGGKGTLSGTYRNLAIHQIGLIWQYEVDPSRSDALAPGDQFGGASVVNISYFAPAYYRIFGTAAGTQANWNKVVDTSYTIIAASLNATNGNATNGLVPAWSTPAGVPQSPNATLPTNYQLDSCRTPFRLGQDYCWYGEARAKSYLAKISAFYTQIGASKIVNGYMLNGTADPTNPTVNQSAAFVGPAGVGAMSDPMFATLRDQAYAGVATLGELDGSTYYTESWTALSLVMMNGGYWNPGP